MKSCDKEGKNCVDKRVSNKIRILWYILAPIIVALVVGTLGYKIGFIIKNPKTGVAIEMLDLVGQAL